MERKKCFMPMKPGGFRNFFLKKTSRFKGETFTNDKHRISLIVAANMNGSGTVKLFIISI